MTADRTKVVFWIGFSFGALIVGGLNYVTYMNRTLRPSPKGVLSLHGPTYSGFPFDMYEHAYLSSAFIWSGVAGNLLCGLALCLVLGWVATKVAGRKAPLR